MLLYCKISVVSLKGEDQCTHAHMVQPIAKATPGVKTKLMFLIMRIGQKSNGWNSTYKGYCTEAAKALCDYGFQKIGLNKICAAHLKRNPASGKVMQKIGMEQEGVFKEHMEKWGEYEDLVYYGMLQR